jgi:uncharacterized protein (DUF952 family)
LRWLYHVLLRSAAPSTGTAGYAPPSLASEGFIHASYRDAVLESARLYFTPDADVIVLQIDPRRLEVPIRVAATPRGPMPHIHGPIQRDAIVAMLELTGVMHAPDAVCLGP